MESSATDGDAHLFINVGRFFGDAAFDDDAAGFGDWRDDVGRSGVKFLGGNENDGVGGSCA